MKDSQTVLDDFTSTCVVELLGQQPCSSLGGLKILELFAGAGGWTRGFLPYGDECIGIDIRKCFEPYPSQLIIQDMRTVDGKRFADFDVIIGSPPCVEFSNARYKSRHVHGLNPEPEKGLELVEEFWRIVKEADPRFYAMENIYALKKYYPVKPQWEFYISKGGRRCLWTNIPLPLTKERRFKHKIRDIHGWEKHRWKRSFIPTCVADFVASAVHSAL